MIITWMQIVIRPLADVVSLYVMSVFVIPLYNLKSIRHVEAILYMPSGSIADMLL